MYLEIIKLFYIILIYKMMNNKVQPMSNEAMESYQPITNFNRLTGTSADLQSLNQLSNDKSGRQQLLAQNAAFKQAITMAIAAKNKADYPPGGPTSPDKKAFQDKKLKLLLQSIGESGDLSSIGMMQSAMSGFNTLGTWGANAARGTQRAVTSPSSTASSVGKSAKSMFGWGGRKRRGKRGTRKAKK